MPNPDDVTQSNPDDVTSNNNNNHPIPIFTVHRRSPSADDVTSDFIPPGLFGRRRRRCRFSGEIQPQNPAPNLALELGFGFVASEDEYNNVELDPNSFGSREISEIDDPNLCLGLGLGFAGDNEENAGVEKDIFSPREISEEDFGIPLCWECIRFEQNQENSGWDDVIKPAENAEEDSESSNSAWERLVAEHNWVWNDWNDFDDEGGFVFTPRAFQVLIGQFSDEEEDLDEDEDENFKAVPPAAKSVVENLPSVVFGVHDLDVMGSFCGICKDGCGVDERLRKLPCGHYYHEDCILPWLEIRNTCPLCRFELPTDDHVYEKWKARIARGVDPEDAIYDTEVEESIPD